MGSALRYLRLFRAFARYSLLNELMFRTNFLVKITVELLWLGLLITFYQTVFSYTSDIATWTKPQYLFFVGCYFALGGLMETLFLSNCGEFAELIRSGDLDFYLLRPIDEQFLISCRSVDWTTAPNVILGIAVMATGLVQGNWAWDLSRVAAFAIAFSCAILLCYSFLLMLTSSGVWMIRNQSLMELWWLVTSLMRYPKGIYDNTWADLLGRFFTYVIPILLVTNMPADVMVRELRPFPLAMTVLATVLLLAFSRWFFKRALRSYRSASS
jgi:ABC-2 type transport system permease protein